MRAGRPGAGRRPLRGQHAGQGQCQSWSAGARALLTQLPSAAGYVATVGRRIPFDPTPPAPPGEGSSRRRTRPVASRRGARRAPVAARGRSGGRAQRGPGPVNALVTSRTDPDAGLVKREVSPTPLLQGARRRGRRAGASHHRAGRDLGEVADEHLLDRLLKEHRGTTGRTVAEVVADTKYGTYANYVALEQQGIRASIPPHSTMSDRGDYSADRSRVRVRRRSLSVSHRAAPHPPGLRALPGAPVA